MADKLKLKLVIEVDYDKGNETVPFLADRLLYVAERAAGNGWFTGDGSAEVQQWDARVENEDGKIVAHNEVF